MKRIATASLIFGLTGLASAFVVPSRTTGRSANYVPKPVSSTALNGFFNDLKGLPSLFQKPKDQTIIKPSYDTVVIDPDFRVAAYFIIAGIALDTIPYIQLTLGPIITLLGALFLLQTFRIRLIFDDQNALELATTNALEGGEYASSGENVVVGGANRWACESIVNYDFFPPIEKSPFGQPILIYFKETQTPSDKWNEGPGKSANDPDKIAAGEAVAGQVHFLPAVANAKQMRDEFAKRGCGKL